MKNISKTQIFGQILLTFILAILIFFCIKQPGITIAVVTGGYSVAYILFFLQMIQNIRRYEGHPVKKEKNYGAVLVVYILFVLTAVFSYLLYKNINDVKDGVKTSAIIYDVDKKITYETEYDEDGNPYESKTEKCEYYIKYKYNNNEYENTLNKSSCHKKVGKSVTIYIDPENPNNITENNITIFIFAVLLSGGSFIYFIYRLIKDYKKPKKTKKTNKKH